MKLLYSTILCLTLIMGSSFIISDVGDKANCSLLITSKTNPITGKISFAGLERFKFIDEVNPQDLELLIVKQNKELTLRFKSSGKICVPKAQEVNFLTTDLKNLTLKNNSSANCSGTMLFNFGGIFGKEKVKDILKDRGIKALSFEDENEDGYYYELSSSKQSELKDVLYCLLSR